ncbi:LuxR family transcriptional regulator [Sphaerisporangium melleum]|uniref:LuxR family transcriptional regulator n=1 Tax=Sphaerisporangium melleum TaxID=321316 RepID=A0A917REE9_9ACTN|nr:LuxR family transcriptional regulator [Sphaerisporangium melleum]GGL02950.1 LuxR family transcriptional regulator [Sphaerisporangium melleum]GII69457.1 LuxR family transcriptional regulator [Sphaerisporangium melleum]
MTKVALTALAGELLTRVHATGSGRAASTVHGGHDRSLRQTVMALRQGEHIHEHEHPGEVTLHVLHGRVRLIAGPESWDGLPGDLLVMPERRHRVEAVQDCAFLFTTAR